MKSVPLYMLETVIVFDGPRLHGSAYVLCRWLTKRVPFQGECESISGTISRKKIPAVMYGREL